MSFLERRYAQIHPYLHLSLVSPHEIAAKRLELLSNSHGLLHYKHVLLHHQDVSSLQRALQELFDVVNHQKKMLLHKKLQIKHSHKKFLQSTHAYSLESSAQQLVHDRSAVLDALKRAEPYFAAGTFSDVYHQLYIEQSMDAPIMHTILAAAHDAHHFGLLVHVLEQQEHVLSSSRQVTNKDIHLQVLKHLRLGFEDELHSLAVLEHQKLHVWSNQNTFVQR